MKETIEYLKRDRRVNDTFKEKLRKVGLNISYEERGYWNNVDGVWIGRTFIPLCKICYSNNGNSMSLDYRYQNEVIKDIYDAIETEKRNAEESDKMVNDFFAKLGLEEG